jgi:hypothetical protein
MYHHGSYRRKKHSPPIVLFKAYSESESEMIRSKLMQQGKLQKLMIVILKALKLRTSMASALADIIILGL